MAVALLPPSVAREAGAGKPRPNPAPGPGPAGMPKTHDGSHIPTPIDNPWALCLLAALVARMLWMDRPPRPDKN